MRGAIVVIVCIVALAVCTIGITDPTNVATIKELRSQKKLLDAEVARLGPYEEFIRDKDISLSYNGCEDIRKKLGL